MQRYFNSMVLAAMFCICAVVPVTAQGYKPLTGKYSIYSGELGDTQSPPKVGGKVNLQLDGEAAKNIFSQLNAGSETRACVSPGDRLRMVGDLTCVLRASGAAYCGIGLDLNSGKSINGMVC